jgi:hypothetical protein
MAGYVFAKFIVSSGSSATLKRQPVVLQERTVSTFSLAEEELGYIGPVHEL